MAGLWGGCWEEPSSLLRPVRGRHLKVTCPQRVCSLVSAHLGVQALTARLPTPEPAEGLGAGHSPGSYFLLISEERRGRERGIMMRITDGRPLHAPHWRSSSQPRPVP